MRRPLLGMNRMTGQGYAGYHWRKRERRGISTRRCIAHSPVPPTSRWPGWAWWSMAVPLDRLRPGRWESKPQCRTGPGPVAPFPAKKTHDRGLTVDPCSMGPQLYPCVVVGPEFESAWTAPMRSHILPTNLNYHPPLWGLSAVAKEGSPYAPRVRQTRN